jgi:hypothetical protein
VIWQQKRSILGEVPECLIVETKKKRVNLQSVPSRSQLLNHAGLLEGRFLTVIYYILFFITFYLLTLLVFISTISVFFNGPVSECMVCRVVIVMCVTYVACHAAAASLWLNVFKQYIRS